MRRRVNAATFLHLWIGSSVAGHAQARSRGFAWFFAHSRPHGTPSGQHVVATFDASGRRTTSGQTFDWVHSRAAFRIACNGDEPSEREFRYRGD